MREGPAGSSERSSFFKKFKHPVHGSVTPERVAAAGQKALDAVEHLNAMQVRIAAKRHDVGAGEAVG